ncbi:phosphate regulon sensor histidine kinase PhoR [Kangiella sp. HZ709]|uniref:phosphate regulon sensor histidine kinase PhoR n=1 Tax=Kangiella sp. HZ709 TaxID=2666328 RepID=UPI0012AF521A|nr:phosphate regulon sensor histidine kinase PhoR [Kangiella sp. HZ709]MRX28587.1 phosphate regulon sensor histidine kinase PhoR [Kangiella sp. HZ709]
MWKSRYWQAELWTLLFIAFVVGLIGSLFSKAALFIAVILFGYLVWNLIQLSRLFHWAFISKAIYPPSAPGIWGELFNQLYQRQRKHRKDLKKLNSIISEFRDSTRALKEGAMIISNLGEIRWFNKAASKLLGLKPSLDLGQRLFNLLRHPDFIEYEAARDYGKPLTIPSPANSELMLSISITPYNEDQRLVIIRDVTEKFHLETVRQDFVANVSHELRTPLTVITGYLEMLDPEINPNLNSVSKPLNMMRQQALNMGHLVDDLLLLSKLDSKVDTNGHKAIDINLLLDSICAEARALSGEKEQQILFHSHTNAMIQASEKQLRSAFSNLVFNAVRYTPAKGRIDIYWQESDSHHIVKVQDNGAGIDAKHLPRLTERFYRVDPGRNRSQGGTGLGLAIVKHVLEYHNAELRIESTLGKGSCFCCYFPKTK